MSSIRLFILGSLSERGPMHGHQLRLLAEQEHVTLWTDISVGALYGAIKRLAADGLIAEVRVEREGAYPERQVWGISESGSSALTVMRLDALKSIVLKPDPFDLAMTKLDPEGLDMLPAMIEARISSLRSLLLESEAHTDAVRQYLSVSEQLVMRHRADRVRAEIDWHGDLLAALPEIIADERARKDG
jgi:DNA-binding PadR family transcriptional regulator